MFIDSWNASISGEPKAFNQSLYETPRPCAPKPAGAPRRRRRRRRTDAARALMPQPFWNWGGGPGVGPRKSEHLRDHVLRCRDSGAAADAK